MYVSNCSYNKLLIGVLLALSRLACARVPHYVPHHRHHRRLEVGSTIVGGIPGIAAVVEGPPDYAVLPPPSGAVVTAALPGVPVGVGAEITSAVEVILKPLPTIVLSVGAPAEIISSVVEPLILPTTVLVGGEITSAVTDILGVPLPTTVSETPSSKEIDIPSTSELTTSVDPTATHTTIDATLTNLPISTTVTSSTNAAVPLVTSTFSTISTTVASSATTSPDSASVTASVTPSTTPTVTSNVASSISSSSSKSKSKSKSKNTTRDWSTLRVPTSTQTVTSTSESVLSPSITRASTEKYSSIRLSFHLSTVSHKPTPTYVIDLSTFPANVSANAPCYNEDCPNPGSGMNYRTTISMNLEDSSFSAGTAERGSVYAAAAVVCALWGALVLL